MIRPVTKKDGTTVYKARIGERGPLRTFTRKRDAEEYETDEKRRLARERAGLPVELGPISYDALCQMYLDNYTAKSKAWREKMVEYSREKFGKVMVRNLRPEQIGAWLHALPLSPKTKTHILGSMRAVLNSGVEWGYLSRSPVRRGAIRNPGKRRVDPIDPFGSWAEVLQLADVMEARYRQLVRFACATGLRPGEWADARWEDVNFETKTLFVRGTKNESAERTIMLSANAIAALKELPRPLHGGLIFTTARGNKIDVHNFRNGPWVKAMGLSGLAYRPPYQMRHTFAVLALNAGVAIEYVSKHMGHSNIQTTLEFYVKFLPAYEARVLNLLDSIGEREEDDVQDHEGSP